MAFQCLQNPEDPTSIKVFNSFKELVNLRNNRFWIEYWNPLTFQHEKIIKTEHLWNFYKTLMTFDYYEEFRRNLGSNHHTDPFGTTKTGHPNYGKNIRDLIPESFLPYITCLYGTGSDSIELRKPYFYEYSRGLRQLYWRHESTNKVWRFTGDSTRDTQLIGDIITTTTAYVESIMTSNKDVKVMTETDNYTTFCSVFTNMFFKDASHYIATNEDTIADRFTSVLATIKNFEASGHEWDCEWKHDTRLTFNFIRKVSKEYRDPILRQLNYSANVLKYLPDFKKDVNEKSPIFYGVELEVACDYKVKDLVMAPEDPFFICKQDGSISGNGSTFTEIVTTPMSLRMHKKYWADLFNKLDYDKFDTSRDTNNGMHVHIGSECITKKHRAALLWFYTNPMNRQFLLEVSERTIESLMKWAKPPMTNPDLKAMWRNYTNVEEIVRDHSGRDRHALLNFAERTSTIEFRLFKGIVSFADILKNLEFIESTIEFTSNRWFRSNSVHMYLKWLKSTPTNKYSTLKEFLTHINMNHCAAYVDLAPILWDFKNFTPKEFINKFSKFKNLTQVFDNHHSSLLNSWLGSRVFEVKEGKLVTSKIYGSPIAHLDKVVANKYLKRDKNNKVVEKEVVVPVTPEYIPVVNNPFSSGTMSTSIGTGYSLFGGLPLPEDDDEEPEELYNEDDEDEEFF